MVSEPVVMKQLRVDKNAEKLHLDMNRVLEETNQQQQTRTELSEEILRDARARLEMVQQQVSPFLFMCY